MPNLHHCNVAKFRVMSNFQFFSQVKTCVVSYPPPIFRIPENWMPCCQITNIAVLPNHQPCPSSNFYFIVSSVIWVIRKLTSPKKKDAMLPNPTSCKIILLIPIQVRNQNYRLMCFLTLAILKINLLFE